jgi:NAD(P)H-flavin reductase
MIAGGTGITPYLQILADAASEDIDFTLIYANKSEDDILVKDWVDGLDINVHHIVENASENWQGATGLLTDDFVEDNIPSPSPNHLVMHCG